MATSFTKIYSVTVTFTKDDYHSPDLTENDIQAEGLRTEIIKEIGQICKRSKGVYQSQPGTVTET